MLERLNKKTILGIVAVIIILLFWAGGKYNGWKDEGEDIQIEDLGEGNLELDDVFEDGEDRQSNNAFIMVHIFGAVEKPGIYELKDGSRVEDALQLAGPRPDALIDKYLNRAKLLEDEEPIFVPTAEDIENSENSDSLPVMAGGFDSLDQGGGSSGGLININTASSTELQALSGVGAVKADAIVQYREETGKFKTIEDIINVTGIGEKTLENLRDQITV